MRFFWKDSDECTWGHCLIAWGRVCLAKRNGGLEIIDLHTKSGSLIEITMKDIP